MNRPGTMREDTSIDPVQAGDPLEPAFARPYRLRSFSAVMCLKPRFCKLLYLNLMFFN